MVLDYGDLAEMDSPTALLAKGNTPGEEKGLFRALWDRHQLSHSNSGGNLAALVVEDLSEV